jgi:hypothetical protein
MKSNWSTYDSLDELKVSGSRLDFTATSIRNGTAQAVSDGSFKDSSGAVAFVLYLRKEALTFRGATWSKVLATLRAPIAASSRES